MDWSAYGWSDGRYRWRTWLRRALPYRPPIYLLVGKGRGDCGSHDWYTQDAEWIACYHCRAMRRRTEET